MQLVGDQMSEMMTDGMGWLLTVLMVNEIKKA